MKQPTMKGITMSHELVNLSLESLKEVRGGLIEAMFNKAIFKMAQDIEVAPDIAEFREVTLTVRAKPKLEMGEISHVITEFVVKGKVPHRVASTVSLLKTSTNGAAQLMFNLDSPDSPDQQSLPFEGPDFGEEVEK